MSKIGSLLAIPIGFYAIKALQKQFPDQPKDTVKDIVPSGLEVGPAGGSGFNIFPEGVPESMKITTGQLESYVPQTQEQLDLTRERLLQPSGTPEQAALIAQAMAEGQGKVTKFGVGTDVVPFFPKGAGDPSLLQPLAGLQGLANLPKFDLSGLYK